MKRNVTPFAGWRGLVLSTAAAAVTVVAGCQSADHSKLMEDEAKMLLISEAQQGFTDVFKATFNPDKTRVLIGADLAKWIQAHRPQAPLPEPVKTAIRTNQGAGLLIEQGLPGKNGGNQDVMYMRAPQFGFHRLFIKEDPDPCGDGNPAMCEYCSGGCTGPGGTGCYCTLGCGECRVCPKC